MTEDKLTCAEVAGDLENMQDTIASLAAKKICSSLLPSHVIMMTEKKLHHN